MERSPNLGSLRTGDWERLQALADQFEAAWQSGASVELANFLPPADDALRPVVLVELLKVEMEIRCRKGQAVRLEEYLKRFPELKASQDLLPRLLYEEYRVRQAYGDRPVLASYRDRFPEHFAAMQQLAAAQPVKIKGGPKYLPFGGGYQLLKRIGSGGFGEVWLAEAPGGIKAAVKILYRPVDHEEAQREIQAIDLMKELRHPFLLQPQSYWASDEKIYIVMELADGSLRDRMKECVKSGLPGIPLAELVNCFREAADALDYLHEQQVQHRDIKPENILLVQRHAKVADFGLARLQDNKRLMTASGSGTPFYMAPEVWRGKSSIHSDQYSLAMTWAELRLDRRVFTSRELAQLMYDHLEATPNLAPMPEAEQVVVRRAMAKEPEARYPSCTEFVFALELALAPLLGRTNPELILPQDHAAAAGGDDYGTIGPGSLPDAQSHREDATEQLGESTGSLTARQQLKRVVKMLGVALLFTCCVALGAGVWHRLEPSSAKKQELPAWLPSGEGWQTVGDQAEEVRGRLLYDRIARLVGDERVEFLCIRKRPGTADPATFYIMENKVWVGLYRKFATERPEESKHALWKRFAEEYQNERFPVFGTSVEDADRFARWLAGVPGGRLPSVAQWNKAAGLYEGLEPGKGPFQEPWDPNEPGQIAVGKRSAPMEVGTATQDRSSFHVRDMAGNGQEWTRDTRDGRDADGQLREVPRADASRLTLVLLRGWSFLEPQPLRFIDLTNTSNAASYLPRQDQTAESDVSFRVVVEIEE